MYSVCTGGNDHAGNSRYYSNTKKELTVMVVALLTAAGIGSRMGQDIPKQFMHVENKPIIIHTMEAFQNHPSVDAMVVVTLPAWIDVLKAYDCFLLGTL